MMIKKQKYLAFISVCLLLNAAGIRAENEWQGHSTWEAFVAQTLVYSSDYNFLSESDDSVSVDLWEAGLLYNARVNDSLNFATQLLGRKISESSGDDVRIDYAFFTYAFHKDYQSQYGVRWGRIRSSYGLYNETRDLPHTRTGIVMPQSIYFDMTRNSFYSADGVELFGFRDYGDNRLSAQLFISKPVADDDEAAEAAGLNPTDLRGDKSILAKISYGSELDGFRVSFTYYRPEYRAAASTAIATPLGPVELKDPDVSFYSENMVTSLEYNQFNWSVTAEYLRHKFQMDLFDVVGAGYEETFYVQGLYRFSEQWEAYVRYDSTQPHTDGIKRHQQIFDDINTGASFRPDEHWLFRAEAHYIEGSGRLPNRDNPNKPFGPKSWSTVLFQVAYKW